MADAAPEPKKKSKKMLVIVGALVVLLAGGGGAAVMMMRGKGDPAGASSHSTSSEIASDAHGGDSHGAESHGGGHGGDSHGSSHGASHGGGHGSEGPVAEAAGDETPATVYKFEHPFVVNLMESSGRWFVQVLMEIETTTPEGVGRAKRNVAPLRDTIIMLLSSKTKDEISTTEGKLRLKQEIIMRVDGILGPGTMKTVYFTDFSIHMS